MMPLSSRLQGLLSIPQIAKLMGKPYRTVLRLIMSMHASDRDLDRADWLAFAETGKPRVNIARLRRRHPAMFSTRYVEPDDFDDMTERVLEVEKRVSETRMRVNSVASRVKAVAGKVA